MTVFNIETLNALGARLYDHADSITNPARHDIEVDCRLAARVCGKRFPADGSPTRCTPD
jgi:hypothetical protein